MVITSFRDKVYAEIGDKLIINGIFYKIVESSGDDELTLDNEGEVRNGEFL